MLRISGAILVALLALAVGPLALAAEGTDASAGVSASGTTGRDAEGRASVGAEATAPDQAVEKTRAKLNTIRERARRMAVEKREAVEKKLSDIAAEVNSEVSVRGESEVSGRLAADFGLTSEKLAEERSRFNTDWGNLMVARTILSNSKAELTLEDLFEIHREGFEWAQIAHGLGLRTEGLVSAAKAEARVATGASKPDGKPAMIASSTRVATNGGVSATTRPATLNTSASVSGGLLGRTK